MSTNSFLNTKPRNFKPTKINDFTVFRTNFKRVPQKIVSVPVFRTNFKVQKGNTENGLSTGI